MANGKSGRKKLAKKLTATIIALIIVVLASLLGIDLTGEVPVEGQLVVHMIDVGQADCFLLIQDGMTALVDCGTRSTGKDAVAYLQEQGITKLDYVIGTHPHDDHMGGMYDVITNFEVGTVIIPDSSDGDITANWYLKLMNELKTAEVLNQKNQESTEPEELLTYDIHYAKVEEVFNLGDATMLVLAAETDVSNTNNYSIVLKVSFGQMDMIMTGDAETEIEEKILESGVNIDAEILKLGHHGSDTSNSEAFLDAISPEYGLISSGLGNKYEHPIKEIMQRMEERNIEVYRTDESGSVVITITTDDVSFSCEPGDYLSGPELEEREGK